MRKSSNALVRTVIAAFPFAVASCGSPHAPDPTPTPTSNQLVSSNTTYNGTGLSVQNLSTSESQCAGDCETVTVTGTLLSTGSVSTTTVTLSIDGGAPQTIDTLAAGGSPGSCWTFNGRDKTCAFTYPVTLCGDGSHSVVLCFEQPGGNPQKTVCTDNPAITVNVQCNANANACLTRTGGFWGTHPAITSQFLPITVCGQSLSNVLAGSCSSAIEAVCVDPGTESAGNPAYAQLVRQLATAELNLAATAANGGNCGAAIAARIAECQKLCGADQATIGASGCIDDLDAFNNSPTTFNPVPAPFDSPGRASTATCQSCNGDGVLIGASCQ